MLDYWNFLLTEYNFRAPHMLAARKMFNIDIDSGKFIVNMILDTELKAYILSTIDYVQGKYEDINSDLSVLYLDRIIKVSRNDMTNKDLQDISRQHYNPIWRVAAFFCDFILRAHNDHTSN